MPPRRHGVCYYLLRLKLFAAEGAETADPTANEKSCTKFKKDLDAMTADQQKAMSKLMCASMCSASLATKCEEKVDVSYIEDMLKCDWEHSGMQVNCDMMTIAYKEGGYECTDATECALKVFSF